MMMKLIDTVNSQTQSANANAYRKVRLKGSKSKRNCLKSLKRLSSGEILVVITLICIISSVSCSETRNNRPPRFLIDNQHSEIVLRLKEGPDTPVGSLIYKLKGFDPDGDALDFGVQSTYDSDIISVRNLDNNEAGIYLEKELDREVIECIDRALTKDAYTIVLTLTDNKLGEGRFVTQSLLLLVEDVNDSEPVFTPFPSAIEVPENSHPGVLLTVEAIDRDEGAYGQVVYYLEELDGDNEAFSISTSQGKGTIRLRKSLDFERKSLYQLKVLAIDRANQGRINTGTAALVVKVKDLEDQGPEFVTQSPVTRISESIPKGSQVTTVRAIDGDRGVNNKIKYSIVTGSNNMFRIDEDTGVITTLKQLDREDSRNLINGAYILEILAVERNSKVKPAPAVKTEITIILTDENDSTPSFKSNRYECEIAENAQQNTPVNFLQIDPKNEVFDHDLGNNGTFELYLDPPNDIFDISPRRSLNEATFIVRVRNPKILDYEKLKVLNFTIVAKEITADGKFSKVPLIVYIKDRNDNVPQFSKVSYNVAIPENVAVGVSIARIEAVDLDSGNFGTQGIRYTGITGSVAQLLNLDPITGIITVKSTAGSFFDRELYEKHYLTVEAKDNLGEGNRNTVPLVITLEDINDHQPIFLQRKYETRLFENRIAFETPLQVEARDADLNGTRNSKVFYEIIDGEFRENFTIDANTGVVKLRSSIDFEKLTRTQKSSIRPIQLTVQASDGGQPTLFSQIPVVINVQDENDFAPRFERNSYDATITEELVGGSSILTIQAVDHDGSAPNNVVYYRILHGAADKFVVGSESGIISVANGASLDPDLSDPKRKNYLLTVAALDGGDQQLSSACHVNITVLDVNNKSPTFGDLEPVSIRENTPVGTLVYRLTAHDMDNEPVLRYFFDSDMSEARSENGVIIKQSEYDYMSAFDLNPTEGFIRVVKMLDREKIETMKIAVVVEDIASKNGLQVATGILNVVITDENDNNPKFQKPFYRRSIVENCQLGSTIINVVATDADKNKSVMYELEGPEEIMNLVHLDAESGEIVVQEKIDHEAFQWLNFTIRAIDSGIPPRSTLADCFIQVIDENDNNPYFVTDFQNLTIYENQPIGTQIAVIEAHDADSGDYGKITFLIDRLSSHGKFAIDPDSGVLKVIDQIDREAKSSYMIVIEIWDNYQFGSASGESRNAFKQFYIKVLDENDHAPVVQFPSQKEPACTSITEFHETKEVVTTIRATDADDPTTPNGQLRFEIRGGSAADLFVLKQVDPWNANVYARSKLNKLYGNYSLNINVKDLGSPTKYVDMKLDICIQDYNDHAPYFVSPINNYTIRVAENATIGQAITQVYAKDEDVGLNALVKYRLKPDLFGNYKTFSINETNGMLSLKIPLDRERQKLYEIRVEAYDQGIPKELSSDLDLIIYVHSVFNYEPSFLVQSISVNFTEHMEPGAERRKLPDTVDRDEVDDLDDEPSAVCYFIVQGNEIGMFDLDRVTHVLSLNAELDREKRENYTLIVKATEDCLSPPDAFNFTSNKIPKVINSKLRKPKSEIDRFTSLLSVGNETDVGFEQYDDVEPESSQLVADDATLVRVIVYIQDINDNPPRFVQKTFTGGVATSADFGSEIMKIRAVDLDFGENAKLSYFLVGKTHRTLAEGLDSVKDQPFLVDKETGSVKLNFDPQKGMKGYFDFTVMVKDKGGFNDTAHVFIYLLREDQRLKIVLRQQNFELRERVDSFRTTLSNVTNAIVNIDDFKVHENKDGTVDRTKTDLYLHLVDKKDNSIIEVSDVLRLVDQNIEQLDELFKEFNVLDTQASEALVLTSEFGNPQMFIWLVMINLVMGALLVIVITLCLSQRTNYRRELKAARVNSYIPTETGKMPIARVPNTNKHSSEGSNPIWLKGYENEWFKNDDNFSQGSTGQDSLDENVLVNTDKEYEDMHRLTDDNFMKNMSKSKEINGLHTQNNLIKHLNMYQQIDKLTNGSIMTKKLETTEL